MVRLNKILIDTNILLYMFNNKKDIFDAVKIVIPNAEFYVLDKVFVEIDRVYKNKPTKLRLIKNYLKKLEALKKFEIINVPVELLERKMRYSKIDNLLIYYSNKYIIYTNDRILRDKIKMKGNKTLTLKKQGVLLN